MGVVGTTSLFKSLSFDGESSRTYNVFITGEGVFNAPERAVEMVTIPGRNGAFALDQGRFENIELTYPASIATDNEADFADAISDFRNFLCSRKGYCRLEDDYNPDEYRLAIYKSGLEVEPAHLIAGEFDITFECKPQRFLKSGETKTAISSGGSITNPTLFDSAPLLEVKGYGNIDIGGQTIELDNILVGDIIVAKRQTKNNDNSITITFDDTFANPGDSVTVGGAIYTDELYSSYAFANVDSITGNGSATISPPGGEHKKTVTINVNSTTFNYGTPGTETVTAVFHYTNLPPLYATVTTTLSYDGTHTLTLTTSVTLDAGITQTGNNQSSTIKAVTLSSTQSALGNPTYIDVELGEAYKIVNTEVLSINNAVIFPVELPALVPGANTITFDNTITELKITPRWFKV